MRGERDTAGLTQSVGQAGAATRALLAFIVLITSLVVMASGVALSSRAAGAVVAVGFIEPVGLIGLLASAFIAAPHSRFGAWLDRFVPQLRRPRVAVATAVVLWMLGAGVVACTRAAPLTRRLAAEDSGAPKGSRESRFMTGISCRPRGSDGAAKLVRIRDLRRQRWHLLRSN